MERSFPWEDGDPPDQALLMQVAQALHGRWRGGDVMAPQCACSPSCVTFAGPGCETAATDMEPGDSAADSCQSLDLGYFVNDEPFRICNHGRGAGGTRVNSSRRVPRIAPLEGAVDFQRWMQLPR